MIERGLRAHTHPRSQPLGGQKLLGRMVQTLALLAAAFGALLFGQRTRRVFGLDGSFGSEARGLRASAPRTAA